jgi:hypothetical protein
MSTPAVKFNASDLGGPIELQADPSLFFSPDTQPLPTFSVPKPPPSPLTSALTPGAGSFSTSGSLRLTDPDSGIGVSANGTGAGAAFRPSGVELTLPLAQGDGLTFNALVGAQPQGFATGAGLGYTQGDVNATLQYRRFTPPDLRSPGSDQFSASLRVGNPKGFNGGVSATLLDSPGTRADTLSLGATLSAPLGDGWALNANGGVVLRPGPDNDRYSAGLSVGNGDLSVGANLLQTGSVTQGTVQLRVNF